MRPTREARLPQLRVEATLKRELEKMARRERKGVADLQREGLDLLVLDRHEKRRQTAIVARIERELAVVGEEEGR